MTRVDHLRQDYERHSLSRSDLLEDPYDLFSGWLAFALASEQPEPTAMNLATVSDAGLPSSRIVLLKGHDPKGLVFYTNHRSRKAIELEQTGVAALCFFWQSLERQVRVEGTTERISPDDSDEYFNSRPLGSRIGAWASPQSRAVSDRAELEGRVRDFEARYPDGEGLVRPEFWGGYRLVPQMWEFWQGRKSRLHDRFCYRKDGAAWLVDRLGP